MQVVGSNVVRCYRPIAPLPAVEIVPFSEQTFDP